MSRTCLFFVIPGRSSTLRSNLELSSFAAGGGPGFAFALSFAVACSHPTHPKRSGAPSIAHSRWVGRKPLAPRICSCLFSRPPRNPPTPRISLLLLPLLLSLLALARYSVLIYSLLVHKSPFTLYLEPSTWYPLKAPKSPTPNYFSRFYSAKSHVKPPNHQKIQ